MTDVRDALGLDPGLCGSCVHAIVRPTRRATTYLRCGMASSDQRFPRYPSLPVVACVGYARRHDTDASAT